MQLTGNDIEKLEEIYTNPPAEKVPRFVRDECPDLWLHGYLRRETGFEKYGLYLTQKGLQAIGAA